MPAFFVIGATPSRSDKAPDFAGEAVLPEMKTRLPGIFRTAS